MWSILEQCFRGQPECHKMCFIAIANITNLLIGRVGREPLNDKESELFEVQCNYFVGANPSTTTNARADHG